MEAGAGRAPDRSPALDPGELQEIQEIQAAAARAGLDLDEAEARQLRPGVRRIRAMAAEVRALLKPDVPPSGPAVTPWPGRRR